MSVATERNLSKSKSSIAVPFFGSAGSGRQNKNGNSKKKKKGKKIKYRDRHDFKSLASIVRVENDDELTMEHLHFSSSLRSANKSDSATSLSGLSRRKSQSELSSSSFTKLPVLSKSPTPTLTNSCPSATPRSSLGCRLPITLPANLQPSAHERRKKVGILSAIKPENEKAERDRFIRANFNYNPMFIYKYPADAEVLERLGKPSDKYLNQAILIMENAIQKYGSYEHFEEITGGKILPRTSIMALIQRYLKREDLEKEIYVNLSEDLLSRGSMTRVKGKPTLNVRIVNLREFWVEGLLRHEIGTHYLRSQNNKQQEWYGWKVRRDLGLRPANPTEEGLASLHSVLLRKDPCLWRAALLYYTAYKAAFMSLKELFRELGQFVSDPYVRWDYCIRAKRGQIDTSGPGAFCKDQVYLEGALQILKNRKKLDFHLLVELGKVAWQDVDRLELLANLDNTRIPYFMQDLVAYHACLDRICEANGLTDEVLEEIEG